MEVEVGLELAYTYKACRSCWMCTGGGRGRVRVRLYIQCLSFLLDVDWLKVREG